MAPLPWLSQGWLGRVTGGLGWLLAKLEATLETGCGRAFLAGPSWGPPAYSSCECLLGQASQASLSCSLLPTAGSPLPRPLADARFSSVLSSATISNIFIPIHHPFIPNSFSLFSPVILPHRSLHLFALLPLHPRVSLSSSLADALLSADPAPKIFAFLSSCWSKKSNYYYYYYYNLQTFQKSLPTRAWLRYRGSLRYLIHVWISSFCTRITWCLPPCSEIPRFATSDSHPSSLLLCALKAPSRPFVVHDIDRFIHCLLPASFLTSFTCLYFVLRRPDTPQKGLLRLSVCSLFIVLQSPFGISTLCCDLLLSVNQKFFENYPI